MRAGADASRTATVHPRGQACLTLPRAWAYNPLMLRSLSQDKQQQRLDRGRRGEQGRCSEHAAAR